MKEITTFLVVMLPFVTLFFGVKAKERNKVKGWSVLTSLVVTITAVMVTATYKEAHPVSYVFLVGLGLGGFVPGLLFTEAEKTR